MPEPINGFGVFICIKSQKKTLEVLVLAFFLHNQIRIKEDLIQIYFDSIRMNLNQISN
jgi:hypothetical protein